MQVSTVIPYGLLSLIFHLHKYLTQIAKLTKSQTLLLLKRKNKDETLILLSIQ